MQPTRHALGALLLEQGHADEAEALYGAGPGAGRDLKSLLSAPRMCGACTASTSVLFELGKRREASIVKQQLDLASARADVPIKSSCFCRLGQVGRPT